jgi:hypothetical protein
MIMGALALFLASLIVCAFWFLLRGRSELSAKRQWMAISLAIVGVLICIFATNSSPPLIYLDGVILMVPALFEMFIFPWVLPIIENLTGAQKQKGQTFDKSESKILDALPAEEFVACEKCGQKLRVKKNDGVSSYKCPNCSHVFDYRVPVTKG